MGSKHGDLRESTCDLFQMNRPHPPGGDIFGFVKVFSQYYACMKQHHPPVLIGSFINRKITRIDVWLLNEIEFAKPTESHAVKFFHLLDHIWSVQIHIPKRDDLGRMLFCRFGDYLSILERS